MGQNVLTGKLKWEKTSEINIDVIKTMLTTVKLVILDFVNLKYLK